MKKFTLDLMKVGTIKKICINHTDCTQCPLFVEGKGCPFEHYFPSKWELN